MSMTLYYVPGACSLASHIILRETERDFQIDKVNPGTGTTDSGANFREINPKGYVPALKIESGDYLTEGAAILQHLADARPDSGLAPPAGTLARTRVQEGLNFISSELHKAFGPLFSENASEEDRDTAKANVAGKLDLVEQMLADGRDYLVGSEFSVADAYLFVVANWAHPTGIGLERWPAVAAHGDRIAARPAVQAAMKAEGLIQ